MAARCILALDLGTTAYKAAPADETGLLACPAVVANGLDYRGGSITCDPERSFRQAIRALRGAAKTALASGRQVAAIGIASQAQTYVALDRQGDPLQPFIVWTDARARREAREIGERIQDFAALSGFLSPSPQQFLPKVMRFCREYRALDDLTRGKFLLLNEYIIFRLTGEAYGDETNQGMGGFYDISRRAWSPETMSLAGITPEHLAHVAPAAAFGRPLKAEAARRLELEPVPVYSCGNDQSCAAAGTGLEDEGDVLCNFGTAMVVYALKETFARPTGEDQIAGLQPLTGRYFLLGLEPECGNIVEWLGKLLYPRRGVARMIEDSLRPGSGSPPRITVRSGRVDIRGLSATCRAEEIARALLEFYAARLDQILKEVVGSGQKACRLFVGGGLSRSRAWLSFLASQHGLSLIPAPVEHPGLIGIERILRKHAPVYLDPQ